MRGAPLTLVALLAGVSLAGQEQAITADHWQHSLRLAGGAPPSLEVDTVWGAIDVVTHDGDTVDVVVNRTISGRSDEARAAALREVRLLVTDNVPALRLYVDGPFRDREPERRGMRSWRNPGYQVRYDFEVRVPRQVALRLRTVNDGRIHVRGTTGSFEVENVNGGIELEEVAGGGSAHTINGDVRVSYRTNPHQDVRLATLNGDVTARFAPGLSADVWLKTFNGDVLTDYEYSRLPASPPVAERRGAVRVWHTSPRTGVRVGAGGPSLDFETFNGDIRILRGES